MTDLEQRRESLGVELPAQTPENLESIPGGPDFYNEKIAPKNKAEKQATGIPVEIEPHVREHIEPVAPTPKQEKPSLTSIQDINLSMERGVSTVPTDKADENPAYLIESLGDAMENHHEPEHH